MPHTEFSDVLFGTPKPIDTTANLGVMEKDMVNIVVHGHDPSLSEMIVFYAQRFLKFSTAMRTMALALSPAVSSLKWMNSLSGIRAMSEVVIPPCPR